MQWNEAVQKGSSLYGAVASWVYDNPVETDLLIIGAVAVALVRYFKNRHVKQRRIITLQRGCWMSRDQRQKLHLMRFEDAITDASINMIMSGEMTPDEEKSWCRFFADRYQLNGLLPGPFSKESRIRGALARITFYRKNRPDYTGGPPSVTVDPSYVPRAADEPSLSTSRYATKPKE